MTREWLVEVDLRDEVTPISVRVPRGWLSVDDATGLIDALTDAIDEVRLGPVVDVDRIVDGRRGK